MLSRAEGASGPAALIDGVWIALAFSLGLGLFFLSQGRIAGTAGLSSFPLDDSWIHFHFARNLAEGHGFAYNPGVPVAGSTAPLWTLLLAGVFALLGTEPAWAKCLGIVASLAAALAARRLAWAWTEDRRLALLTGAVTALTGPLVWGALSGMEVSLAALLVTAALVCHAAGRDWLGAALLGLGALARPEAMLLLPLYWLAGPITFRRTAIVSGVVGMSLAPWVLFNLVTTGAPLPATASAKVEGGLVGFLVAGTHEPVTTAFIARPWQFVTDWVQWLGSINILLPGLIPFGLWVLWRRGGFRTNLPAAVLLLHPVGMALLAPFRGPAFQEGRYSIHLLPLAFCVAITALKPLTSAPRLAHARRSFRMRSARRASRFLGLDCSGRRASRFLGLDCSGRLRLHLALPWLRLALPWLRLTLPWLRLAQPSEGSGKTWRPRVRGAVMAGLLVASLSALPPAAARYGWAVQNIDAMQVHLGHWVVAHTPAEARLALNDVGAIAFISRREIVDVMGVVTPAAIPYHRAGEAGVLGYLERTCPDYLIIFPAWFPTLAVMTDRFTPIYRVRLDHNTVGGADEMVVYETPWNRWRGGTRACGGRPNALHRAPQKSYNST